MNASLANESFLLTQFRDFYAEVIHLKRLIKDKGGMAAKEIIPIEVSETGNGHEGHITAKLPKFDAEMLRTLSGAQKITSLAVRGSLDTPAEPSSEQSKLAELVRQNLIAIFRRNAIQILRAAGKPTDNYFEAQYVMAALADDIFIHLEWEGKRAWMANTLESTLFHSHVAGEMVFDKLDRLLRDPDPAEKSLAAVYLSALSLGFRGKYHGLNDHGKLRRYRRDLFNFVFRKPPDLEGKTKVAFPDSYIKNLREEDRKKLVNPRVWLAVLGLVLLTYLAGSHGIWLGLTSRLERTNTEIVEIENRLERIPPPAN